jgi:hypothetical protein
MADESVLFTYITPFVGVLLVAVGIGGAVPGGYAIIQEDIATCGDPTMAVEGPEATAERFSTTTPEVERFNFTELSAPEQAAFRDALDDPVGEAHVNGSFPNGDDFRNGSIVRYEGADHYVTVVSENPCYATPALQFPLGVFAIIFGVVGILTPPIYRKLVALEEQADFE